MPSTIEPNGIYTAAEVATLLLRHSVRWFYRNHRTLKAQGFPNPISPNGRPRWSGALLLAWRDAPKSPQPAGPNVLDYSQILRRRGQEVAARRA